ncbi:7445_t:CDS:1, partial [Racocetra persica]
MESFGITIISIIAILFSFETLIVSAHTQCIGSCKKATIKGDGTQLLTGFCSSLIQGQIPSVEHMVSALIINPTYGQKIEANTPFTIEVKVKNLETGFSSEQTTEFYTSPQELNDEGIIKGHSHIVIQKLNDEEVPDATTFAYFQGLNDEANNDVLSTTVELGLFEPGLYRLCTMCSSFSHQPVIMPREQRGAQDDCIRFEVISEILEDL